MKIVITECDHDAFEEETAAAAAAGVELVLTQSRTPADVVSNAATADGIVVQYADITARVMDALPELRVIGRYGVGVDTVDVRAATERGIAVCNVPDYGTESVSDHAIALTLSVVRGITQADRAVRAGNFDLSALRPLHQLRERTFGVIGMGLIGAATARKAAGLGYRVITHDAAAPPGAAEFRGVESVSLAELLRRSHVISLHTPLTENTRHLIGQSELAQMRPDAIVVNTSRGEVIDLDALATALAEGRLAGAGLDVFDNEPLPTDHALAAMANVVLTPHIAWYSEESYSELKRRTLANVAELLSGRLPVNILNPEVLGAPGRNAEFPAAAPAVEKKPEYIQ